MCEVMLYTIFKGFTVELQTCFCGKQCMTYSATRWVFYVVCDLFDQMHELVRVNRIKEACMMIFIVVRCRGSIDHQINVS